jgi:hypothetical protein
MNAFDIEILRQYLIANLPYTHGKSKIFFFYNFYQLLLNSKDESILGAYTLEFIEEYLDALKQYSAFCIPPQKSEDLVKQIKMICELNTTQKFHAELAAEVERINLQVDELKSYLSGIQNIIGSSNLTFPLIEENGTGTRETYGFLEKVRITVSKQKQNDKLWVYPKLGELDNKIEKQILNSFQLAKNYLSGHKKKFGAHHEITVHFDNYAANYIGNSLGIALTVGFIEQLSKLYNLPFLVKVRSNIASTGGVNENGKILPVNKSYIEKKVEAVFYSSTEIFIVPKQDEENAVTKLNQLKKIYPLRNLKIVGVSDLDDILDRRNLIIISKQNPLIRTAKASIKNWQLTTLLIFIYIITVVLLFRNFDDNPMLISNQGKILYVKNKSGIVLWTKKINIDDKHSASNFNLGYYCRLADINDDGHNEIIITHEAPEELENVAGSGRIVCLDMKGDLIWKYNFPDSSSIAEGIFHPLFSTNLIDIAETSEKKFLYAFASSRGKHESVIFKLDLQSGKRVGGILINAGYIKDAITGDFDKDGLKEIAFATVNNSSNNIEFGVVDLNNINGKCPALDDTVFTKIPYATLKSFLVFPNNKLCNMNFAYLGIGSLINNLDEQKIYLRFFEAGKANSFLTYKIDYDFKNVSVSFDSEINNRPDSIAANINLNSGRTIDRDSLNKNILFWNGNNFAKLN